MRRLTEGNKFATGVDQVSFTRLPDRMVGYATWELAELLGKLTGPQRDAIDRIVQHVYIENLPWADLFRGDDRICAETSYYRKGKIDDEGKRVKPGWGHDEDFQAALKEAMSLALQAKERERLGLLNRAKRYAEQAAGPAVQTWVNVMAFGVDDRARNEAAQKVIDLAFKGSGPEQGNAAASVEQDWWAATVGGK